MSADQSNPPSGTYPVPPQSPSASGERERRRVIVATIIGTTIEWYDFFIYASAAALVFSTLFFDGAGDNRATLLSFASVGVSFVFRPLGAMIAGHLGDRLGRRPMLVLTLSMMGVATVAVGLLPTAAQIGVAAPILLVLLRILQGISAGGEWGGAVLMAVEHAPDGARGRWGAAPQIGVPLGLLLSSGVMALMTTIAPGPAFQSWGWRVPFLLSAVLVVVGIWVRTRVEESPIFLEVRERRQRASNPLGSVLRRHWLLVLLAALTFAGNNAAGYMTTGGFIQRYVTDPKGEIKLPTTPVLWIVAFGGLVWLGSTLAGGILSDRIGRKRTYYIGWACQLVMVFPLFWLVNTGSLGALALALALFSIGLGLTYGPQAAFFSELFPAPVRFAGIAVAYALGAVLGGAFAPTIATALVQNTGSTTAVSWYLLGMTIVGLLATIAIRSNDNVPLVPVAEGSSEPSAVAAGAAGPAIDR